MKTTKLLSMIACMGILMGSCADNEPSVGIAGEGGKPSVTFSLGGAAKKTLTRAYVTALDEEKTVNDIIAVLYNTHTGFYKIVEPKPYGADEYQIAGLDDATYSVYFIVNASDALKAQLNAIPAGTLVDDATYGLEQIVTDQAPDVDNNFLMMCANPATVTTTSNNTESLGEIHIQRLSARFDIVNAADGVTINKVTYTNRAVKGSLAKRNSMPADADWYENTKSYNIYGGLTGSKEEPQEFAHEIYSYENYSVSGDVTLPVFTIEYTANGVTRTHDVAMKDEAKNPIAIKRNNLYRIILSKGHDLNFDLQVLDWDEAETFNITDLPFETEEPDTRTDQQKMNDNLWVNMFTDFNVKSINTTDNTVEFYSSHLTKQDNSSYFGYSFAGYNNNIYTDKDGKQYRIPNRDELALIAPVAFSLNFNTTESLNTAANENLTIRGKGTIKGSSSIVRGSSTATVGSETIAPIYGLRFKGTDQYSAYKWESIPKIYISVKIKALSADSSITLKDIKDNYQFWNNDCIEYRIYSSGYIYSDGSSPQGTAYFGRISGTNGFIMTSPSYCYNQTYNFSSSEKNCKNTLRLVKVD
ncbi:MAG: hypothetical protein K2M41_05490 [Muribaculaceae bacterium]|nr:hypothetical protein [Muribaculaceae bacterium]